MCLDVKCLHCLLIYSLLHSLSLLPIHFSYVREHKQLYQIGTTVEYDGSPRRFGMTSNDDVDYYTTSQSSYKYGGPLNSPPPPAPSNGTLISYSSSSPPRPGFPQRILSHSASNSAANAVQIPKSYSFDDHQSLLTSSSYGSQQQPQQQKNITTTSTLIPTTFIKNSMSAYELLATQEKTQQATIVEEEPEIIVDPQDDDELGGSANMIMVLPEATIATCSMNNTITATNLAAVAVAAASLDCVDDNDDEDEPQMHTDVSNIINNTTSNNTFDITSPTENLPTSTFDYLYEFSETRKVLEEFFKCPDDKIKEFEKFSDFNESDDSLVSFTFLFTLSIPFQLFYMISCLFYNWGSWKSEEWIDRKCFFFCFFFFLNVSVFSGFKM